MNHRWIDARRIPSCETQDGCDRTERQCARGCGLVMITVHPPRGYPYRRWRVGSMEWPAQGRAPKCEIPEGRPSQ